MEYMKHGTGAKGWHKNDTPPTVIKTYWTKFLEDLKREGIVKALIEDNGVTRSMSTTESLYVPYRPMHFVVDKIYNRIVELHCIIYQGKHKYKCQCFANLVDLFTERDCAIVEIARKEEIC